MSEDFPKKPEFTFDPECRDVLTELMEQGFELVFKHKVDEMLERMRAALEEAYDIKESPNGIVIIDSIPSARSPHYPFMLMPSGANIDLHIRERINDCPLCALGYIPESQPPLVLRPRPVGLSPFASDIEYSEMFNDFKMKCFSDITNTVELEPWNKGKHWLARSGSTGDTGRPKRNKNKERLKKKHRRVNR
jgi:hypothetical protein